MGETIRTYKAFNPDLTCRGFQYEIGGVYETDEAEVCKSGFHACEYPLDVLNFYPSTSRFCEVEQSGKLSRDGNCTKVSSTRIKVIGEIGIPGLVKAAVEYTKSRAKLKPGASATGTRGAASADHATAVAVAWGVNGRAKGVVGSHLVMAEWVWNENEYAYDLKDARMVQVDGCKIKPDTYYSLVDGKIIEVN